MFLGLGFWCWDVLAVEALGSWSNTQPALLSSGPKAGVISPALP